MLIRLNPHNIRIYKIKKNAMLIIKLPIKILFKKKKV